MNKINRYKAMLKKLMIKPVGGFLYELKDNEFIPVNSKISENYEIRLLSAGKNLEVLRNLSVKEAFQKMEKEGQLCVGAYIGEELVGHAACILPGNQHGAFKVRNSAYIHYCYVKPEWRGYNIYPSLLSWTIEKVIKEYSINRVTITTSKDNISSQKGLKKVGFRFVRKYLYITWWRIIWKEVIV